MERRESRGDTAPRTPDGPPPAREQLPLPRRRRQAHLEPQLRTPGSAGAGTPFAAFGPGGSPAPSPAPLPDKPDPTGRADRGERTERLDRAAAAFHAGTRRGRSTVRPRRATPALRPNQGPPPPARPEH